MSKDGPTNAVVPLFLYVYGVRPVARCPPHALRVGGRRVAVPSPCTD